MCDNDSIASTEDNTYIVPAEGMQVYKVDVQHEHSADLYLSESGSDRSAHVELTDVEVHVGDSHYELKTAMLEDQIMILRLLLGRTVQSMQVIPPSDLIVEFSDGTILKCLAQWDYEAWNVFMQPEGWWCSGCGYRQPVT